FLRLSADFDGFFDELRALVIEFLDARGVPFDQGELDEVIRFQDLSIPRADGRVRTTVRFERALARWFEALFSTAPQPLAAEPETVEFVQPEFAGDLPRYARETILWGRKSGTMLAQVRRLDDGAPAPSPAAPVAAG